MFSGGGGSLVPKSYLILCDLMNYNPPGSSVHGILQERILERVAQALLNLCLLHCRWILYH